MGQLNEFAPAIYLCLVHELHTVLLGNLDEMRKVIRHRHHLSLPHLALPLLVFDDSIRGFLDVYREQMVL